MDYIKKVLLSLSKSEGSLRLETYNLYKALLLTIVKDGKETSIRITSQEAIQLIEKLAVGIQDLK
jgi:hypothetical protein